MKSKLEVECVHADCIQCVWALMVLWVKVRRWCLQIFVSFLCILQTRDLMYLPSLLFLWVRANEHNTVWMLKEVTVYFLKMLLRSPCFFYCSLDGLDEWLQCFIKKKKHVGEMKCKCISYGFFCITFVYLLILKLIAWSVCIHRKNNWTENVEVRVLSWLSDDSTWSNVHRTLDEFCYTWKLWE